MLFGGALLEYSIVENVHNGIVFSLSRVMNPQIESENDCLNELAACLTPHDLKFFLESISNLDSKSYERLEVCLLRSFMKLLVGYTADLLISLIQYHENSEKKYFATINHNYLLAKKTSHYGYKKLIELETIASLMNDSLFDKNLLIELAEKLRALYGFANNNSDGNTIFVLQGTLHSFFAYKNSIEKSYGCDIVFIKNWFEHQIKDTKKRFLVAGLVSYGLLMFVVYYFFGHIDAAKNDFIMKEESLIADQTRLALTEKDVLLKGISPAPSTGKSFDANYFVQKEASYKKSYYPLCKLADFFHVCDVAFKAGSYYVAQLKDLLKAGSKTVQNLENSALNNIRKATFFADISAQYIQGMGSLGATLIFLYCAYHVQELLKIRALDDFKVTFELFEKELYTEFTTDLHGSERFFYLQLLLMREGKKVLSSERLFVLQSDIERIRNFKSWDLAEIYLKKMKKTYHFLS